MPSVPLRPDNDWNLLLFLVDVSEKRWLHLQSHSNTEMADNAKSIHRVGGQLGHFVSELRKVFLKL